MKINAVTRLYCLIGDPVSKSLSPFIHNYVFENLNYNKKYMAFNLKTENLNQGIQGLKALGVKGFNATIPHKIDLLDIVDEIDSYAENLQSINTVKVTDGRLKGYNTDGPGLIKSLEDHDIDLGNSNVLILGAGGAARGISLALATRGCNSIGIQNRTLSKAEDLVSLIKNIDFKGSCNTVLPDDDISNYDVVINTTSIGMYPDTDEIPIDLNRIRKNTVLVDIVYKPHMTRFLREGSERGNKVIHGIEMLVYQALLADEIFLDRELDKVNLKNEIIELAQELGLLL